MGKLEREYTMTQRFIEEATDRKYAFSSEYFCACDALPYIESSALTYPK